MSLDELEEARVKIAVWTDLCHERQGWKHHPNYRRAFAYLDFALTAIDNAQHLLQEIEEEGSCS